MQSQVPGLLQPQIADCWKPKTLSATPAAISDQPAVVHPRRPVLGRPAWTTAISTRAMIATGMLTQKIARQVHWVR